MLHQKDNQCFTSYITKDVAISSVALVPTTGLARAVNDRLKNNHALCWNVGSVAARNE